MWTGPYSRRRFHDVDDPYFDGPFKTQYRRLCGSLGSWGPVFIVWPSSLCQLTLNNPISWSLLLFCSRKRHQNDYRTILLLLLFYSSKQSERDNTESSFINFFMDWIKACVLWIYDVIAKSNEWILRNSLLSLPAISNHYADIFKSAKFDANFIVLQTRFDCKFHNSFPPGDRPPSRENSHPWPSAQLENGYFYVVWLS